MPCGSAFDSLLRENSNESVFHGVGTPKKLRALREMEKKGDEREKKKKIVFLVDPGSVTYMWKSVPLCHSVEGIN